MSPDDMKQLELEALRVARKHIEKGWCQHAWARDADGYGAHITHEAVVSWCLQGALALAARSVAGPSKTPSYASIRERLHHHVAQGLDHLKGIQVWNDHPNRTQAEVLKLLDDTIARIDSEGSE